MEKALTFNAVEFATISRNNQPWIRSPQIGEALGYAKGTISIAKLYDSHADEFTDEMTAVVKLPTEGGEQDVRIFSLRGCHLLAMFARTPVAKAFRKWVLDVLDRLDRERQPQAIPQTTTPSTAESRKPLRALVHAWSQVTGVHHAALWPQVKAHFQLSRIDDLPEEWMADALAFVQGKIDEAGRASHPSGSCSEIPNSSLPGLPVPVDAPKQLKTLHAAREKCRWDFIPQSYTAGDREAAERRNLQNDLYKLQDCLWAALYNICSAAAKLRA